uniref:NSP4 n=1 Tax=Rotavirus I TaxID=1637496 RepID=A0A1S6XXL3_9REOV|nr:NSP4 [Rotavirus I]
MSTSEQMNDAAHDSWNINDLEEMFKNGIRELLKYIEDQPTDQLILKITLFITTIVMSGHARKVVISFIIPHIKKFFYLLQTFIGQSKRSFKRETEEHIDKIIDPLKEKLEYLEKELFDHVLKHLEEKGYTQFTPYIQTMDRITADLRKDQRELENKLKRHIELMNFRIDAFMGGRLHDIVIQNIDQQINEDAQSHPAVATNVRNEIVRNKFRN